MNTTESESTSLFDAFKVVAWLCSIIFVVAIVCTLLGCGVNSSHTRVEPGRATINQRARTETPTIAHETRKIDHLAEDGSVVAKETVNRVETGGTVVETQADGVSQGAGVDTTADSIAQNFNGSAPTLALPGGASATGGDSESMTKGMAIVPKNLWGNPLLWVGILCFVGAGVAVYFRLRRAAMISAGVGVGLIAAALFPGLALLIAGVVVAALAGVYLYAEHKGRSGTEALRAVVAGVAGLPETTAEIVKGEIAKHADPKDKATIAAVKLADNL